MSVPSFCPFQNLLRNHRCFFNIKYLPCPNLQTRNHDTTSSFGTKTSTLKIIWTTGTIEIPGDGSKVIWCVVIGWSVGSEARYFSTVVFWRRHSCTGGHRGLAQRACIVQIRCAMHGCLWRVCRFNRQWSISSRRGRRVDHRSWLFWLLWLSPQLIQVD